MVVTSVITEAHPADLRHLQDATVDVIARIHAMDARPDELAFLELDRPGDTALRRHVADTRAFYEWVVADGMRSPLLERGFADAGVQTSSVVMTNVYALSNRMGEMARNVRQGQGAMTVTSFEGVASVDGSFAVDAIAAVAK